MGGALSVAQAEAALRLADVRPREAADLAAQVLAVRRVDAEAASVAERALGIAHRTMLDNAAASRHLRRAVRLAHRAALPSREGQARLSLAVELLHEGRPDAALRELDRAAALVGDDEPQVHNQRAVVLVRLGRYGAAHAAATTALRLAEVRGDRSLVALVLGNRGVTGAYCGRFDDAEADLRRAVELCRGLGQELPALEGTHNLGWLLARRGDLPAALARYDEAEAGVARLDAPLAPYRLDRCEALLAAGLADEAHALADAVVEALRAGGIGATVPEALVLRARAALAAGDPASARADAEAAARSLRRQGRPGWAALATSVALRATDSSAPPRTVLRAARAAAHELAAAGWAEAEQEARLVAARAAHDAGRDDEAEVQLRAAAAGRRAPEARRRALAWYAEAVLRDRHGNRAGALRAADAGLRASRAHRAALGSTELHASAAAHDAELSELATGLALAGGRPATVLAWSERLRGTTLLRPPLRPPDDRRLADDLAALRSVDADAREHLLAGEPVPPALARRRHALEEAVRRRAHHAHGAAPAVVRPPSPRALHALLDGRRLVVHVEHAGRLHAVVADDGRLRTVALGSTAEATTELRHLTAALRRQVRGDAAAAGRVAGAAERLGRLLLPAGPVGPGLVVVPVPALHGVPWSLLPGLAGRPVEVAPSVAMWARRAPAASGGVVAVAGPDLASAEREAAAVAAAHGPGSTVLAGPAAVADDVLRALDGAALAHLACHAVFRADSPQLSALLLADGPVTVYDLEGLRRAPATVVLSACESARGSVRGGAELLGLTSALFALGTRCVVASVVPVADGPAADLMVRLHARLAAGDSPADALAAAGASAPGDAASSGTAAAFVCVRAGRG
ncbi:MAG TPA: CHAT domain-containing protein [Mycobacteriales bacterium]|nr:CHAT domain-containing protein [Mycobacteriales bacterium]